MKKSLSLILVFAMVLSMLPGTALATGSSSTDSLYSNGNDTEIVVDNQDNIYSNGDDTEIVVGNQNDIYSNGDDTEPVVGNPMPVTSIAPQQSGTGTENDPYLVDNSSELIEAIANPDIGYIKLTSSFAMSETVTVPADRTITLDLNGKTISQSKAQTAGYQMILNNGNLTIQDSGNGGTIRYTDIGSGSHSGVSNTITNKANLTLKSGIVENLSSSAISYAYAIDNADFNSIPGGITMIMENGLVRCGNRTAIRARSDSATDATSVTISGGELDGRIEVQKGGTAKNLVNLTITGGTFANTVNHPTVLSIFGDQGDGSGATVNISGGNFTGTILVTETGSYAIGSGFNSKFITGGTFSNDPSAYVAEGYTATENNGFWIVDEIQYAAKIGETPYTTLQAAFNAVQEGETIQLMPGTIDLGNTGMSLPLTMTNVTIAGSEDHSSIIKNGYLIQNGSNFNLNGITFEGILFEDAYIVITPWDGNSTCKNLTVNNCIFQNLDNADTMAPLHITQGGVENVSFTNNVVKNLTGGNKSGIFVFASGTVTVTGNIFDSVAFRSVILQIHNNDSVADNIVYKNNITRNSPVGRIQILGAGGSAPAGTDAVTVALNRNIITGVTNTYQFCVYNFNSRVTSTDLSGNYYDIDIMKNPGKIYVEMDAESVEDLVEMGIFPIYTDLTSDSAIDTSSSYTPSFAAKIGDKSYYFISDAINDATDGTTVDILPGTFDEYIAPWVGDPSHAIEKSITLRGAAARNEGETVLTGGLYLGYDDSQNRSHNIIVEGITFQTKGILVAGQNNVTIRNNKFENITDLVATSGSATENAISVIGKDVTAIIENNVISTVTAAGINLRNTKSVAVSGNTITAAGETSVLVQNNSAEGAITITGNTMSGWGTSANQGRAVRTVGGSAVTVTGNKMINAAAPEEFVKCTGLGEGVEVNLTKNYWNGQDPATQDIVTVDGTVNVTMAPYFVADTMRDPQDLNVEPTYTVTMVGKMAEDSGNGSYPAGTTVTINAGSPATGYVFEKWTSEDGVVFTDATSSTTTFVMPAKNVTVTATWKALPRFSVTFKDGDSVIDTKDYLEGETIVAPSAPTKTGYTFEGWIGYTEGMTVGTAHLTFVAQWSESSSGGTDSPADPGPSAPVDPAPSTPTTPTAPVTPPAVEVPEVNDTTIDTSAPTVSTETKEDEAGNTTTTETKQDGTVVETTQKADGSTTTTATKSETTESEDGSKTTTSTTNTTTTDSTGATITEQKQESKTEAADGSVTTTVTENITTTDSTGATVTEQKQESKIEAADGSVTTTTINNTTKTDAEGNTAIESKVEEKVETENTTTTTTTTTTQDAKGNTEKTEAKEETVVNEDGTTTTTTSSTTETALANGSTGTTVVDTTGQVTADVTISEQAVAEAAKAGETVALPMPAVGSTASSETAPVINVTNPSTETVTVEIPVAQAGAGTVVVIVHEDGSEEIVPKTAQTENGLSVKLAGNATVKVVDNAKSFGDTENHWAGDAIDHASSRELFDGVGDNSFAPDETMNRAMLATVLWRLEGKQEATTQSTFDDLESGHWSEEAVLWASENDIIKGSNGSFDGEGEVTREQMVTMLYRMSGSPAVEAEDTVDGASDWAADAVAWAVKIGLMKGDGTGLNLQGSATRAQIATFLMRFVNMMY